MKNQSTLLLKIATAPIAALVLLVVLLFFSVNTLAVTITSTATGGSWQAGTTWVGGVVPTATDSVAIAGGANVTIDGAATCVALIYKTAASVNTIVTINGNNTLSVSGLIFMARPLASLKYCMLNVNSGSVFCDSLNMNATTAIRNDSISVSTGTLTILGSVTTGTTGCKINISSSGTINFGGLIIGTPVLTTSAGSTVNYASASNQTILTTPYSNLTISGGGAKTINASISVNGILSLTSGILTTTATKLLTITNTSSNAIVGGSSTSFINGPLKRNLPPSYSTSSNYIFPVGKTTTYLSFSLNNPTTDTGIVTTLVEAFLANAGGTFDASINSLCNTEYWSLTTTGYFTNSSVSISRPSAISPFNSIAGSSTLTGVYTYLAGSAATFGVTLSNPIALNRYFVFADGGCTSPPAAPGNPTSNSPQCLPGGVTITRTGTPPANEKWYWQTSPTATSTSNFSPTYVVTTSGTYYLRAQNITTSCWSMGTGSTTVIVNSIPNVATPTSSAITQASASLDGNILSLGCTNVTTRGFYYDTANGFPNGSGYLTSEFPGPYSTGPYSQVISGLLPLTTYYYKSFATNSFGTYYSAQSSFTTGATSFSATNVATFGTSVCVNYTVGPHSFVLSGTFLTPEGIFVSPLSGFTYSTTATGTYSNSLTLASQGGSLSQTIYVKFTPTLGQSYNGNIVVSGGGAPNFNVPVTGSGFISAQTLTAIPTSSAVTGNSAILGGEITSQGCSPAIERGIYYSTVSGFSPPGQGTKVSETAGPYALGAFTESVTGLTSMTTYYFRSFATNNEGTAFSSTQGQFTTLCGSVLSYPWTENFDAMTTIGTNVIPSCWKAESGSGTPWASMNAASVTYNDPVSSPNYMTCNYTPYPYDKYLITPAFFLSLGDTCNFSFKYAGDGYTGWDADVRYNTAQTGSGSSLLGTAFLTSSTTSSSTYTTVSRTFTPPATGTYYFMIHVYNNVTPYYLGFDDFKVTSTSSQPPSITSLGSTQGCVGGSLTIHGTNLSGVTASNVKIGGTPVSSISSNTGTTLVVVLGAGTNGFVSITNANGTTTDSVITFTFTPAPTLSGSNNCLFVGSTVQLSANPSGGTWYSSALNIATVNVNTGVVSGVTTGNANITYLDPAGCIASTTITATPSIVATFSPASQNFCAGTQSSPIIITGNNIGTTTLVNWTTSTPSPNTFIAGSGGVPYYSGNVIHLTDAAGGQIGGYYINNPGGFNSSAFTATFDMRMYDGTGGWFADGMSFNYGNDMPNPPSGSPEEGQGTGLSIAMHEYGYTGGPYIYAKYNGVNLTANVYTVLHTSAFQTCIVDISSTNQLTVKINGTTLINVAMPAAYIAANKSTWKFNFASRTGWAPDADGHQIRNVSIIFPQQYEYSFNGGISYQSTNSFTPPIVTNASYNIGIRQVGSNCPTNLGTATISTFTTPPPTGDTAQEFIFIPTVADLVANGTAIKWYDSTGALLLSSTVLVDGHSYYASQTSASCESSARLKVTVSIVLIKTVRLHLFLEGLFNNSTSMMNEAMDGNTGLPVWGPSIADRIQVDLFEENAPYAPLGVSISGIDLATNGLASFQISPTHSANYYIRVSNRNHLSTWSAIAVPFNTTIVTYYFNTGLHQAYGGDPQVQVSANPDLFAFFLGDLDQGGWIDALDFNLFEPDLTFGSTGFYSSDFDGGGWVDAIDFNLFEQRLTFGNSSEYPAKKK